MRKPIIAGNWKMYKTKKEVLSFIEEVKNALPQEQNVDAIICVPYVYLDAAAAATQGSNLKIAAQNMHDAEEGAYTGEISPKMLVDLAIPYVVLGHSERRQYFNETDETVNKKVHAAFENGIVPIVCVGESLEERENGTTDEIVAKQTLLGLKGLTVEQLENVVIAYEPIWAIGTGKVATSDQAQETIAALRKTIADAFGADVAQKIRIQYGGSVKPDNVVELLGKTDIDGALVGGASLVPESFLGLFAPIK